MDAERNPLGAGRDSCDVKPVRLAIVGAGAIASSHHVPAALRSPALDLCALVDKKCENARALARRYALDGVRLAESLEMVIGEIEAVLIATPNDTHYPIAELALSHRIPVLVEKPFTTSYAQAVALCELAEQNSTLISVGYVTRHFPSVRLLKDLLESGYLGRIHSFHYEFGAKGGWESISGYNVDRRRAGGGVLINAGTHFIDKMLYWFGQPQSFAYEDDNYGGVEANVKAAFRFGEGADGFRGTFIMSSVRSLSNRLILDTDRYVCHLGERQLETITVLPKDQPGLSFEIRSSSHPPARDYFQVQLEEFAAAIRHDGRPTVDGWSASQSVRLIEDMYANRVPMEEPWLMVKHKSLRGHLSHV